MSSEKSALALALSKAQGQMKGAIKDAENPYFKSTYADLASVWDACRKPLSDNELAIVQITDYGPNAEIVLKTTLIHSSGEQITGIMPIMIGEKATAQQLGSAITYARRYALSAIVGVAPEDDDGNKASEAPKNAMKKWAASTPGTEEDAKAIAEMVDNAKTIVELDNVIYTNANFTGSLKESHPKWHAALIAKIDSKRLSFAKGNL